MQLNVLEYLEEGALRHCPDEEAIVDDERAYSFGEEAEQAEGVLGFYDGARR